MDTLRVILHGLCSLGMQINNVCVCNNQRMLIQRIKKSNLIVKIEMCDISILYVAMLMDEYRIIVL